MNRPVTDDECWVMALSVACSCAVMRNSPHRKKLPFLANLARFAAGEFDEQLNPLMEQLKCLHNSGNGSLERPHAVPSVAPPS